MSVLQPIETKKGKGKLLYRAIITILIAGIPLQVFPYIWMFSNSFKNNTEIIRIPPTFIPLEWKFDGFVQAFVTYRLWENIFNTAILCISVIVIQVAVSSLAAFSLSKLRPRFGRGILMFFICTMMISTQALIFPLYLMMANFPILNINLINNFWAYILPSSAWAYVIFLFKGFFDGLPGELIEAARIDGASNLRIFGQLVVPLSKPVFSVVIINTFIAVYNDFMMPLLMLPNESKWTMVVRIYAAQSSAMASPNSIFVMLTVATIPVIVVYLFAQKTIVQGIVMTGLKG